jgi:Fe-Mn family superoxide dismutase
MSHKLPNLGYAYDALEPHIDAETMEIHHGKHHAGYVKKLNSALESSEQLQSLSLHELLSDIRVVPEDIRQAVRNNGGGHHNHSLFWKVISPGGDRRPGGDLSEAIDEQFESFDAFRERFSQAALSRFGSGWAWLGINTSGQLEVLSTANQDSPLMHAIEPILGLDVWEHAYYLKYRNRRADYVQAWWNVVNWSAVSELHSEARRRIQSASVSVPRSGQGPAGQ